MVTLTLKIPLSVTPSAEKALLFTAQKFTDSFNRVASYGWEKRITNSVSLHRSTYAAEKASGLPSQLICSARMKASEALKSVKSLSKNGRNVSQPIAKSLSIRYDARSFSIRLAQGTVTMASVEGRQKAEFKLPRYYQEHANKGSTSATLVFSKGKPFLHVVVECEEPKPELTGIRVGVDLGVKRPAVTSNAQFFGERRWRDVDQRYFRLKRSLQSKGTKSAKRRLRQLSGKVNRFRNDCDHVLSKRLVQLVDAGTTLVFEDLTNIRQNMKARKTSLKRRLHAWSFARLVTFTEYKATRKGVYLETGDPAYTSQTCSRCQHVERGNRKGNWFKCKACGYQCNADLNASRNIQVRTSLRGNSAAEGGLQSISLLRRASCPGASHAC